MIFVFMKWYIFLLKQSFLFFEGHKFEKQTNHTNINANHCRLLH